MRQRTKRDFNLIYHSAVILLEYFHRFCRPRGRFCFSPVFIRHICYWSSCQSHLWKHLSPLSRAAVDKMRYQLRRVGRFANIRPSGGRKDCPVTPPLHPPSPPLAYTADNNNNWHRALLWYVYTAYRVFEQTIAFRMVFVVGSRSVRFSIVLLSFRLIQNRN